MSRKDKTIYTKQDIQKQGKKFNQQIEGECTKIYQQLDDKDRKQFWS